MSNRIKVNEINKYQHYQVPKEFLKSATYDNMSCEAILLYAVLKDRMELSRVNNWVNKFGEIYFIFTREELMGLMRKSKPTIIKAMKELIEHKLVEEERQGHMKPNKIYICDLVVEPFHKYNTTESSDITMKSKIFTSCSKDFLPHEVKNLYPNDTDINNTDINNSVSQSTNIITMDGEEERDGQTDGSFTENTIKSQIGYISLIQAYQKQFIDEIVINILDMYYSNGIKIKGTIKPQDIVRNILSKLTYWHISYINDRYNEITIPIKAKKDYLQTMIYTAVLEMDTSNINQYKSYQEG